MGCWDRSIHPLGNKLVCYVSMGLAYVLNIQHDDGPGNGFSVGDEELLKEHCGKVYD